MRFPGRLAASLLSASIGWAAGNAVTSSLILLDSPTFDWTNWARATAYVCPAAWALAGIPLALSGARFPAGPSRAKAILLAGLFAGGLMTLYFGPAALASPEGRTLLYAAAGQALATGGIAMLVYCLLTSARIPHPLTTNAESGTPGQPSIRPASPR